MPRGGLDLGIERAGFQPLWFCENDKSCLKVLAERWPDIPVIGDVGDVGEEHAEERPTLLVGGFPCGDLSYAGRRAGLEGDRSGLWFAMGRSIRVLQPRMALIENVPGLMRAVANGSGIAPIGVILADLAELGYDARWGRIRAADVGAPHQRSRVFIVAWERNASHSGSERFNRGGDPRSTPNEVGRRFNHTRSSNASPDTSGGRGEGNGRTEFGAEEQARWLQEDDGDVLGDLSKDASYPDDAGRKQQRGTKSATTQQRSSQRSGSEDVNWGIYREAIERWEYLTRSAPRPTDDRGRLNPRFSEWLMGFPEGWVNVPGVSRTAQLRMLGNAVVPQVSEALGYYARDILKELG
jgi:DNA (cytosine-5)-methyltransferase 1